ncbi:uncharacterized protein LOC108851739 [Raphanus sativus]|uniref:Uncharacterized protein LOC108851739 n=1 Tax=Raphanus sativus TaxID=3726 RepID=A0A6J0N7P6_RAPSA|nr:uncharacterized protein LOC108851739 [Raphanus sativus]XP_056846678.1 uncharacterized protein LOC108851739 [Raphanus sativus]XP_056846679.1 uncharacterized protein LOC108851739 [Raphanus sativus]XP_056846680.1 uncharacterized protein LOC108851739 [Raphanus sativus]
MYRYLNQTGAPVVLFLFCCLMPSSIIFLILHHPWKGRALSNQQIVPSLINGVITALYFILWGQGLKPCGPLRAILSEYSGAVFGVLSGVLYVRRGHVWQKVGGLIAMLVALFFLSQGWATSSLSPFSSKDSTEIKEEEVLLAQALGLLGMMMPVFAGILSALRRVIARRVSLKNQRKKRLHAITITSATCFLFPLAMWDLVIGTSSGKTVELPFSVWAFLSTIAFGIILIFYVDNIAEQRLHMVFSSPRHLMVAGACIIVMEIAYEMDFSLPGFIVCCLVLGFGIFEATSLERSKKDSSIKSEDQSNGVLDSDFDTSPILPI